MRVTHTYALLEVSPETYREIRAALEAADYVHTLQEQDDGRIAIDMHGIALVERADSEEPQRGEEWHRGVRDLADAVNATIDEDGMDVEGACARLGGLMQVLDKPERWSEFRAPPEEDSES